MPPHPYIVSERKILIFVRTLHKQTKIPLCKLTAKKEVKKGAQGKKWAKWYPDSIPFTGKQDKNGAYDCACQRRNEYDKG